MTKPLTEEEYMLWRANIQAIAEIHESDTRLDKRAVGDKEITTTIGMQLRLFATIDALHERLRMGPILYDLKKRRREEGRCLLCGATGEEPGEGCYKWTPANPTIEVWAPHSWPEETPQS